MEDIKNNNTAPEEAEAKDADATREIVGIRFRGTGKVYYFAPNGIDFKEGEFAIVETVRGVEYGSVAIGNRHVPESEIVGSLKPVIRKANDEDAKRFAHNLELEEAAKPQFIEAVKKNQLVMQLVDVEYTFDNAKLIFYFTADGRVDFRDLVKDLASIFRTRIELRQIGVRDEAKMLGGLGICGRKLCCASHLGGFEPVSIKMAKEQNLSLNPTKISGTCSRLMCCLKYEQNAYEDLLKTTPPVGSIVKTPMGQGTVMDVNLLKGILKIHLEKDNDNVLQNIHVSDVEVIKSAEIKVEDDELKMFKDLIE